jgi:hypothetical protein
LAQKIEKIAQIWEKSRATTMRGNELPVSAARWQIYFATSIHIKITKLLKTQQPLKLEKKISTDLES